MEAFLADLRVASLVLDPTDDADHLVDIYDSTLRDIVDMYDGTLRDIFDDWLECVCVN